MPPESKSSRIEGRVPLDDMKEWIAQLGKGKRKLSHSELQLFFEQHLATAIALLINDGMNKDQVRSVIMNEVTSGENKPTPAGLAFIDKAIDLAFEE